jgi:transcriptional regulator with XRE-family HTH domain
LRDREGWSQQELAEKIGSTQNAIYRAENPNYGKQTLSTLKKIAAAFDVALVVRFIPFSELVDWVSGTKHVDFGLSTETFDLPSFETEELNGEFDRAEPIQPQRAMSEAEEKVLLGEDSQPARNKEKKGKLIHFDRDSGYQQQLKGGQRNDVESSYALGA